MHHIPAAIARTAGGECCLDVGLFLQALFGSLLSVLIAIASYHAYETPFLRLKRLFKA